MVCSRPQFLQPPKSEPSGLLELNLGPNRFLGDLAIHWLPHCCLSASLSRKRIARS